MSGFNNAFPVTSTYNLWDDLPIIGTSNAGFDGPIWQRWNGWPPENGAVAGNNNPPFSPIFTETSTGAASIPALYHKLSAVLRGRIPHRVSGAVRVDDDHVGLQPVGSVGSGGSVRFMYSPTVLTINTVSFFSLTGISLSAVNYTPRPPQIDLLATGVTPALNTSIVPAFNVNQAAWYRVGVEVLPNVINFYVDPTAASDPSTLADSAGLELVYTHNYISSQVDVLPAYTSFASSGHYIASIGGGIANVIVEQLQEPPGSTVTGSPGGTGPDIPSVPGGEPVNVPAGQAPRSALAAVAEQYSTYKSIRKSVMIYNNLSVS